MKLPHDHPVRNFPDDFLLYQTMAAWMMAEGILSLRDYDRKSSEILRHAYTEARRLRVPGEAVSKVLTLIRRVEMGLKP